MFADDTTLYESNNEIDALIQSFNEKIRPLACWCKFNKLDINWSKTFAMFITKKRIELPQNILVLGNKISIVKSFKLLGITIDNKLSFINYVSQLRITVNKKLFSIKNLFNLPTAVKLQFFKSFIMPHYDYCSTLFIYFNKDAIQKLVNSYNICLNKLLGLKLENDILILLKNFT